MRNFFYLLFTTVLIMLNVSCEKEETQLTTTRDYLDDALVLQEFVRINKNENKYYLDMPTKEQQPSSLADHTGEQLELIFQANQQRFIHELDLLNDYIQQQTKKGASYILMQTKNESYLDLISGANNITFEGKQTKNTMRNGTFPIKQFPFTKPNENPVTTEFYAEDKVYTKISMFSDKHKRNLKATLTCQTGTTTNQAVTSSTVVITSPQATFYGVFNWENTEKGSSVHWIFKGAVDRSDILSLVDVYNGEFLGTLPEPD